MTNYGMYMVGAQSLPRWLATSLVRSRQCPWCVTHLTVMPSEPLTFLKNLGKEAKIRHLPVILHHHHHYVPSVVNRSAVMDSIHDSLRYVHGGGPIPSMVTGHKSGSFKTVPVMCHTSYCHGFWAIDLVYWFFCLIRHSSLHALKGVTSPIHQSF